MADVPDLAGPRDIRKDGTGAVIYGSDDGMLVEFHEGQIYMEYLSKQLGYPIFAMRIFTLIRQPGNRNTVWDHETKGIAYETVVDGASGEYHTSWDVLEVCENGDVPEPAKYPAAWNRFLKKGISADSGVPIEQWGTVTRSYAESLKSQNVHTVEALAGLSDQSAQNIMGAIKYRDLARAYLDDRQKGVIVAKEQERAARFEELYQQGQKQLTDLQAAFAQLQAQLAGGGNAPLPSGMRPANQSEAIQAGLQGVKQMSTADAKKKHKIPASAAA